MPLELIAARIAWANAATKKEEAWQRKMDKEEHLAQVQADLSAMEDGELVDSDGRSGQGSTRFIHWL